MKRSDFEACKITEDIRKYIIFRSSAGTNEHPPHPKATPPKRTNARTAHFPQYCLENTYIMTLSLQALQIRTIQIYYDRCNFKPFLNL